jgi:hypothetical protein
MTDSKNAWQMKQEEEREEEEELDETVSFGSRGSSNSMLMYLGLQVTKRCCTLRD